MGRPLSSSSFHLPLLQSFTCRLPGACCAASASPSFLLSSRLGRSCGSTRSGRCRCWISSSPPLCGLSPPSDSPHLLLFLGSRRPLEFLSLLCNLSAFWESFQISPLLSVPCSHFCFCFALMPHQDTLSQRFQWTQRGAGLCPRSRVKVGSVGSCQVCFSLWSWLMKTGDSCDGGSDDFPFCSLGLEAWDQVGTDIGFPWRFSSSWCCCPAHSLAVGLFSLCHAPQRKRRADFSFALKHPLSSALPLLFLASVFPSLFDSHSLLFSPTPLASRFLSPCLSLGMQSCQSAYRHRGEQHPRATEWRVSLSPFLCLYPSLCPCLAFVLLIFVSVVHCLSLFHNWLLSQMTDIQLQGPRSPFPFFHRSPTWSETPENEEKMCLRLQVLLCPIFCKVIRVAKSQEFSKLETFNGKKWGIYGNTLRI